MKSMKYTSASASAELYNPYLSANKAKFGLICVGTLLERASAEALQELAEKTGVALDLAIPTKQDYVKYLLDAFLSSPDKKAEAKSRNIPPLELLGLYLQKFPKIWNAVSAFDFVAISELTSNFADLCADLGINVFACPKDDEYQLDLYLTKKDPTLKTEAVVVLNGYGIETNYPKAFMQIERSGEISDWKIFVTTPAGAIKIGWDRLLEDMKRLDAWLYLVDPYQRRILGVTKGGKSKRKDDKLRDDYIRKLPQTPIRAPSQVVKICKFDFKEGDSYKPKEIQPYYIPTAQDFEKDILDEAKYRQFVSTLLLLAKSNGLSILSYSPDNQGADDVLISGFLSALDSFVKEVGGGGDLKEIDYQNFKINSINGDKLRVIAIGKKPVDQAFRERLKYFVEQFEGMFELEINGFIATGNRTAFDGEKPLELIRTVLLL